MTKEEQTLKELDDDLTAKGNTTEDGWPKGSPEAEAYAIAYRKFWDAFNAAPQNVRETFYLIAVQK